MILVANKVDLVHQRKVTEEEGKNVAAELGVSECIYALWEGDGKGEEKLALQITNKYCQIITATGMKLLGICKAFCATERLNYNNDFFENCIFYFCYRNGFYSNLWKI